MKEARQTRTGGFSLIEVIVAITILALIVVPIGSAFTTAFRLNARSDRLLQAQLAVSGAVETLMAEGYDEGKTYSFPNVTVEKLSDGEHNVKVSDQENMVVVETYIRPKK